LFIPLICSRVPIHQNSNVFVAPHINSGVVGLPVFSRTILGKLIYGKNF